MAKHRTHVGIDVGHSMIRVVMTAMNDGGQFAVIGVGESLSDGFRKGHVFDLDALSKAITSAVEQAEGMSGEPIEQAYVTVSDRMVESVVAKGVVAISRSDGEIDQIDIDRVLASAATVSVPNNNEVLSSQPIAYTVDHQVDIQDPLGMTGIRLEVDTHIMYASESVVRQVIQAVLNTGIDVLERMPSSFAAAVSVLSPKQKELGCVLLDMGCDSTTMMIYMDGVLVHSKAFEIGSEYITHDVAIGLKIEREIAERLKVEYGTCAASEVSPRDVIDLSTFGASVSQLVSRRDLADIIEARLAEIVTLVGDEIRLLGIEGRLPAGVVVTGGGAKLPGIVEYIRDSVSLPTQYGFPAEMLGLADRVDDPSYSAVVGLIMKGSEGRLNSFSFNFSLRDLFKSLGSWYKGIVHGK